MAGNEQNPLLVPDRFPRRDCEIEGTTRSSWHRAKDVAVLLPLTAAAVLVHKALNASVAHTKRIDRLVELNYVDGPRVSNAIYSHCSPWVGTLNDAKYFCNAKPDCKVLYNFGCDQISWHYCDHDIHFLQAKGEDANPGACTMILGNGSTTAVPQPARDTSTTKPGNSTTYEDSYQASDSRTKPTSSTPISSTSTSLSRITATIDLASTTMSPESLTIHTTNLITTSAVKFVRTTTEAVGLSTHQSNSSTTSTRISATPTMGPPDSLYCYMVVEPYELDVVRWQFKQQTSIFKCDAWTVLSDRSREAHRIGTASSGNDVFTVPISGPKAIEGYKWGQMIMYNTGTFMRAWNHLISADIAAKYGWLVKVDADSVFFPDRLIPQLQNWGATFMYNCKHYYSMQGPLEVISRQALAVFSSQKQRCLNEFDWEHLPEDVFLQRCLSKLGVAGFTAFSVMQDINCFDVVDCHAPGFAVYHPLKGLANYSECFALQGR